MKASEIRDLNDADLASRIAELEEERFRLRFRGATEQLEDPLRLRHLRRDVARLMTVQRQRALEGAAAAKAGKAAKAASKTTTKSAAKKGAQGASGTRASAASKKAPAKKAATGAGR